MVAKGTTKGTSGEAAGASTPAVPAAAEPPDGLGKSPERTEEAGGALIETAEPVAEADAPGGGAAAEAASAFGIASAFCLHRRSRMTPRPIRTHLGSRPRSLAQSCEHARQVGPS